MATTIPSTAVELDLRQFAGWCQHHQLHLFAARRADIESFARDLEARGRARATITRRLCTIAGFYRTPSRKNCWANRPPRTCGSCGWTTSRTLPGWTATSSALSWWRPGLVRQRSMR